MLRVIIFSTLLVLASSIYELNPDAIRQEIPITVDKSVIVIDNFFKDFDLFNTVERVALPPGDDNYYPGIRYKITKKPDDPFFEGWKCGFSVFTMPPEELVPPQKIPHSDGAKWRAFMVYLEDRPWDGTGFYKHKPTGQFVLPGKAGSLMQDELEYVKETDGYITSSNDRWELLFGVEMKKNRAIMYDGDLFHSSHLQKWVPGRETFSCFKPLPDRVHWSFQ